MPDVITLDGASLDSFTTELIAAGFEPVRGTDRREWDGPCPQPLAGLTPATSMRIRIRDGWPFRHPHILVSELPAEHVNAEGVVCLWAEDDNSRQWLTLNGINERIEEWANAAARGFDDQDVALDAYLAFNRDRIGLATFDMAHVVRTGAHRGQWGRFHGTRQDHGGVHLQTGKGPPGSLHGLWFHCGDMSPPPHDQASLRSLLTVGQQGYFDDLLTSALSEPLLILMVGNFHGAQDAVVLRVGPDVSGVGVALDVYEPAMTDDEVLCLRCGPDAEAVSEKHVVVFGLGAIGSHVAVLLARCGVGSEHLIDGEMLRPGNVVRHAAAKPLVGFQKVEATRMEIEFRSPWTRVEKTPQAMWDPDEISKTVGGADAIVDASGSAPLTEQLSRIAERDSILLVSVSLYRDGSVSRVRRFRPGVDVPIHQRLDDQRFPIIPADSDTPASPKLELGCSAPVNNASPAAVVAASSLASEVVLQELTAKGTLASEIIDVIRPLAAEHPFETPGRYFYG